MAADSRSTHTDALATLGTIIGKEEKRDAIHLGVEPAMAGEELTAGAHVGFNSKGHAVNAWEGGPIKPVGIVDPFLGTGHSDGTVFKGQRFWLIAYPRQITSLRHVWEHPDFPDSGETGGKELMQSTQPGQPTSEQIHKMKVLINDPEAVALEHIRKCAKQLGVEEEELLEHAKDYQENGNYWSEGGRFESVPLPTGFWEAYEIHTKTKVDDKYSFLSCSC